MANWQDPQMDGPYAAAGASAEARDAGLRSYMLSVYNYMLSGVLLTGVVALLFAKTGWVQSLYSLNENGAPAGLSALGFIVALSPLAVVLTMNFGIRRLSTSTLQTLFWVYAFLVGLSLSTIFVTYTDTSIAQVFFGTAAGFAGLSLWGYTTKRDLSGMGTFLIMGLIGLIVAMVVNMFIGSGPLSLAISVIGVLIFAGLTAYDTQKIKSMYAYVGNTDMRGKAVVMGALTLYLDFINMFLFLLRLFGSQRN
ncbi:Bax inhibitor-1/YccA family protein [Sphingomonas sp. KR3-1]|uniref:Bax inhibitor-1/YccA family protein n=1 Tax=Sphingomonas sp. KR3-1 TaxID=3156611 RepID=UPI0032B62A17